MTPSRPGRHRPPAERPTKHCARCGLPFTWRRKWIRDWDAVRYCSERCRRGRGVAAQGHAGTADGADAPAVDPPPVAGDARDVRPKGRTRERRRAR